MHQITLHYLFNTSLGKHKTSLKEYLDEKFFSFFDSENMTINILADPPKSIQKQRPKQKTQMA